MTPRLRSRPVEVLKVAHHGSEDPGCPTSSRRLAPRVAVISVGEGNDYDHPRARDARGARGRAGSARRWRTDEDGRVVVESDGRVVTVRSER